MELAQTREKYGQKKKKKNKEKRGRKSFATTELELMENDSPQTLQEKRKWRNRQGTETGSVYNNKYEVIKERLVALSVFPATSKQVVTPYKWWIALKFKGGRKKKVILISYCNSLATLSIQLCVQQ